MPDEPRAKGGVTSTDPLSERAAPAHLGGALSVVFHYRDGVEIALLAEERPVVVGRAEPAGVCVPDRTLSREHARFSVAQGRVLVEDLGSTNGIWLAGARVERAVLEPGGEV